MSAPRRLVLATVVAALLGPAALVLARGADPAQHARVAQLAGVAGCVQDEQIRQELLDDEQPECALGSPLVGPTGAVVSPDGKWVYVAASGSDAITWLTRNGDTGQLGFAGCLSDDGGTGLAGTDGKCVDGDAVDGPRSVAISPDGAHLYAAAAGANGVLSFARNGDTGALQQLGCIKDYVDEGRCVDRYALGGVRAITVAPDGKNVYAVASGSDSIVTLERDPGSGRLTFTGCTSDDGTNGRCTDGEALRGADGVAVSPDGKSVYVAAAASGALVSFQRDPDTGALTQTGCELTDAPSGPCDRATSLTRVTSVTVAPDGQTVFATAQDTSVLSAFRRDADTGKLTEAGCVVPDGTEFATCDSGGVSRPSAVAVGAGSGELLVSSANAGLVSFGYDPTTATFTRTSCVSRFPTPGCSEGHQLSAAAWVTVSPDGRNAYIAAPDDDAVAVFAEGAAVPARSGIVRRGVVRVPVACPRRAPGGCRGVLELTPARRAGGTVVRRFRLRAGRSSSFALHLSARSQRALARHRRLRATVTIRERGRALPALDGDFLLEAGR